MRIKLNFPIRLSLLAQITNTRLCGDDTVIEYLSTDTHDLSRGDLFWALQGEKFDGADFTDDALTAGAYVLSTAKNATLKADSATEPILLYISYLKTNLDKLCHTVAITGSVGKTSTKEMLRALLSVKYRVHASRENENNLFGLFYTLLTAPSDTEILITELGMNCEGEISILSRAVSPDIGVITNVGSAHIGKLGSSEAIAQAKLELADGLRGGCLIIPNDEPLLSKAPASFTVSLTNGRSDLFVIPLLEAKNGTVFDAYHRGKAYIGKRLNIPGRHILSSFSFALAAALSVGISESEIDLGLCKIDENILRPRFRIIGKYTIYDDTYSASPEAMAEVMKMLTLYKRPVSAVLGDMLELGEATVSAHEKIGLLAAGLNYERLYLVGEHANDYARGAVCGGISKSRIHVNESARDLSVTAKAVIKNYNGEILLIKGSHALHLEKIAELLKE